MNEEQLKLVQPILNTFENKDIMEFAKVLLEDLPDYVWHVGASSTGKYHPAYSLGEMGLMRHQVAVVRLLNHGLKLEQYNSKLSSRERDLIRLAGLVHDGRKSGSQTDYEKSKYTKFNHPILMADVIRSFDGQYLNHNELELVADAISKHMGEWNTDKKSNDVLPKPDNKFARMLHLADYLASRKDITMEFDNFITEKPAPTFIEFNEDTTINFGKHKGERYIDVYGYEPDYFDWAEKKFTASNNITARQAAILNTIKAMREYIKSKESKTNE